MVILAQSGPVSAGADKWVSYTNARFGTQAVYPADLFSPGQPPANGAGLTFTARDGASITIQGTFNSTGDSLGSYKREYYSKDYYPGVTYQKSGKTWFVISGIRGGSIYYEKVIFSCRGDIVNMLSIVYPKTRKNFYASIVERVENSFKPGRGADTTPNCT